MDGSWPAVGRVGALAGVPPPGFAIGSPLVVPPLQRRRGELPPPRRHGRVVLGRGSRGHLRHLEELVELGVGALDAVLADAPELGLLPAERAQVLARALALEVVDVPPDAARAGVHRPGLVELVGLGPRPWNQNLFPCATTRASQTRDGLLSSLRECPLPFLR